METPLHHPSMKKIENLDLGHTRHGLDKSIIVKISDVYDDKSLEADFPHRHNFYMICLVVKGSGLHVIDFETIEIKPGRLFFLKPEQVHFWQVRKGSKLAVVQFSAGFPASLTDFKRLPAIHSELKSHVDLTEDNKVVIFESIRRIDTENNNRQLNSDLIIQAEIVILLARMERLMKPDLSQSPANSRSVIVENFKGLIEKKFKDVIAIVDYARLLNITPNYLNILVKKTTGLTATEFLHNRVILEAKRLLINNHYDIVQVAFELGFKDASYFSRFFKRLAGMSPSAFRNSIYKKYQHPDN